MIVPTEVLLSALGAAATSSNPTSFAGRYFAATTTTAAGANHAELLDQSMRMLSISDEELMTASNTSVCPIPPALTWLEDLMGGGSHADNCARHFMTLTSRPHSNTIP